MKFPLSSALFAGLARRLRLSRVRALRQAVEVYARFPGGQWHWRSDILNGSVVSVAGGMISVDGGRWQGAPGTDWELTGTNAAAITTFGDSRQPSPDSLSWPGVIARIAGAVASFARTASSCNLRKIAEESAT